MKEVRLGTIGSGKIVRSILNCVRMTDGIKLEAVYSRSEEKGKNLADAYDCEKVYTDIDAFLADTAINTIYIATPNILHYEQAKKALEAGKHVICEKPFVTKLSQAQGLARIAKERNLFLVEAVPTSFLPNFPVLKKELSKIGKVKLVMSNFSQYSSRYDEVLRGEKPAIFDPAYAGGCLMDINFYNIHLNVALFGKPAQAAYYPNMYPGLADTSGIMVMRYDGFISQNVGAKDTWGVNFFQIEGEDGYIYVENGSNGLKSIRTVTKYSEQTINKQEVHDRLYYEVQELTRIMLSDDYDGIYKRLGVTLDVVEVMEKARKEAGILFPGEA